MRQPAPRRWQSWRLTLTARPAAAYTPDVLRHRMAQPPKPDRPSSPAPAVPAELRREVPGPDGIRHGLVAHVRALIAAGAYDTPERWEAAEERLFRRVSEED